MEQYFNEILNNIFEGIIIIGDDFRIMHMNRAAQKITGFLEDEAVSRFCYEILRAKNCKKNCPIRSLKDGRDPGEIIVNIIAKDNREKYIKVKVFKYDAIYFEIFYDVTREIELEKKIKEKFFFKDIITRDKRLIEIINVLPRIAATKATVLLEGESGVGKEVFASAIQSVSPRKEKPFIKINCAALPDSLLESELFGYKKGAFTGAFKDKPGLFIMADKGTLFLDEIGEINMPIQAKLLRAVETGEIIPLGGTKSEKVDVRIMTATNKDLMKEVQDGNFREDLLYRLNVVNIKIPSLRERKNDIPLFIEYFIDHYNKLQSKNIEKVSTEVMETLLNHEFPGNVREMSNIIEYAFIFCNKKTIQLHHLPQNLTASLKPAKKKTEYPEGFEQLSNALEEAHWNRKKTAEILKIDRTTLWRKMKKYGLK